MIKTKELKGFKSLRALNVFHALLLGLKMLPEYQDEAYEDFFSRVDSLSDEDKEKIFRKAVLFVELNEVEVTALASFCLDPNGVPYDAASLKNQTVDVVYEMIIAVCKELAKIKIDFVTDDEKKK